MKSFSAEANSALINYIGRTFSPEDQRLRETRETAQAAGLPPIQVGAMDGLHLEVIALAAGARKAVEIGTLSGYSGIHLARALGTGGILYTCEYEPRNAEFARRAFSRAGLSDRTEVLVGPALDTLPSLNAKGPFDLVFIDADKVNYPAYLRWATENLRVGGVLLGDNTFGFGMIADDSLTDPEDRAVVSALREFNLELAQGGRFRATILPTGEGMTFAVKIR